MFKKGCLYLISGLVLAFVVPEHSAMADSIAPPSVQNQYKSIVKSYIKPASKTAQFNWAPAADPNFENNKRNCNGGAKNKVESIGKLTCEFFKLSFPVNYVKTLSNGTAVLVYSALTRGGLAVVIMKSRTTPVVNYVYSIDKYPTGSLVSISVRYDNGYKMVFDRYGKLRSLLYNKTCYSENKQGVLEENIYASSLCSKMVDELF